MTWTDAKCGATIHGNDQHCPKCHNTFTTDQAGDAHRAGPYDNRVCLNPAAIRRIDKHDVDYGPLLEQNNRGSWRIRPTEARAARHAAYLATKKRND